MGTSRQLPPSAPDLLAQVVREDWGRLIALLVSRFRRLDLAEDALADAVAAASDHWPADGVPATRRPGC